MDFESPVQIIANTIAARRRGIEEKDLLDMFTEFYGPEDYRAHIYHRFVGNILGVNMASKFADIDARCRLSLRRMSRRELVEGLSAMRKEEVETYGPPIQFVRREETETEK